MRDAYVVGSIDVAALAFYAFVLFFIALVFYLRREDRREGYPLEDEFSGRLESPGGPLLTAETKTFDLPFDKGSVTAPTKGREPVDIAARRRENFAGAPYSPTGDPLTDGIGPAAFALRAPWPDLDAHGAPRIVPLSMEDSIAVAHRKDDPRGKPVIGADRAVAGTVADLWVDRAEHLVRYLEIDTGTGRVLAPMMMAVVRDREVVIDAVNAADFARAPYPETAGQITRYEEERVAAFFGGGYLYANSGRQEPWL
ncbi:photosynthetic reaction center subunit H [Novosphingobium marinum]|uniref:Photosynthetic reaction center H subunit n=1 Tax=Novosphingobium marinum TaxID=1514948 RepID=A0A7Y9XXI5_9SPHN|nr:photosynthetic reaction center subunit H [Novosphingobium marinum]NYH96377.1 photosynthetic reaction center H subunit [Novosphingobium marinum]GGC34750.1 photosynthetic reaction center subunit H [Novosphingobium marinum]